MANEIIAKSVIFAQLGSEDEFCVDLDEAYEWIGYGRKADAENLLSEFTENLDYIVFQEIAKKLGRPRKKVKLTVDCFKSMAMMSRTPKGKQVRQWYLEIEKEWKALKSEQRKLTSDEIASICLLPGGRDWSKRFDEDYYRELSRLTGLNQFGNSRPPLWGKLTDEWVYRMLPVGIRDGVRKAREEHGGWHKLHQFLSDDGLKVFEQHMNTLLIVMKSSETVNGVRRGLRILTSTEYQCRLFDDCRKDGKLTISRQIGLVNQNTGKQSAMI